jgi:di/tricarboxylate transporter
MRQGVTQASILPDLRLQAGDVLLVQGDGESLVRADLGHDLLVLAEAERRPASRTRAFVTVAIVAAALTAAATSLLPLQAAAATGILLMVLSGVLSIEQAYRAIDWRIIVLIGGISPLSLALTRDGITAAAAHLLVTWVGPLGHLALLGVFFWLAAVLTQVVSNVAAALVLAPLAVSIAGAQHLSPYPLVVAMVVALSAAPLTPLANKVFLMAMGPGGYRYQDFFRIGLPLTLLMFTLVLLLVPVLFPFSP